MTLYLVRHGEAVDAQDDALRRLTENGERNVKKIARFLAGSQVSVSEIVHSGKTRAQQTAVLLAEQVSLQGNVRRADGLAPLDEPSPWEAVLAERNEDLMVVGHLPFLARLCSLLLCGQDRSFLDFSPGGVACLVTNETGSWRLKWTVMPELLGQ